MRNRAGASNAPLIDLRGVGKEFLTGGREVEVLRDVNLAVDQGEFLAIVGKSGSGKSTLLNMITGIDHPSRGSIVINETEVHALDESHLAKWRGENIGIVFQFFQLIPTLTIEENLLLAMDFVNTVPRQDRAGRAESLLAQVGIAEHADKLPASLSGGEQQRAAIARALANDPPILVADEPTGNLDSKTADSIHTLFAQLAENGKTVIVVTHERTFGPRYDRTIALLDGAIVSDSRNELKQARMG